MLGIVCLPIAALLIGVQHNGTSALSKPRRWLANLTWISVVLWVASFGVMIATFLAAEGSLPASAPESLPHGVIALVGWTNRLVVVSAWAWIGTTAWHALQLHTRLGSGGHLPRTRQKLTRVVQRRSGEHSTFGRQVLVHAGAVR